MPTSTQLCGILQTTTMNPWIRSTSRDDIAEESLAEMRADCVKFAQENAATVLACFGEGKCSWSQAGHDFWMTRTGSGCGFWDGDWPKEQGELLTDACKAFGECNLYVGDDGKVYC